VQNFNKILIIQTAFLGDAILTTPLIRALKQTFHESLIDILIIPETAIVFENNPHIHRIISFDKRNKLYRTTSFFKVLNQLQLNNYDLAVSAQLSFTSSLLMYLSGIPNRLGFPRQRLLTMTIDLPKGIPVVKRYLRLMTAITDQEFSYQTELFWDKTVEERADFVLSNFCKPPDIVVGLAPGSIWPTKRWPAEYFSELITMIARNNIKVILIGGNDEVGLCKLIANNSRAESLNLAGKLSILGSAAVIKRMDLIVTNDSAPMHLANAVETDVIAIFGPTVQKFGFYPFRSKDKVIEINLTCRPCGKHGGKICPQKHFRCMKAITPDLVLKNVLDILELS
jgi:heptosyltransferase II